MHEPLVQVQGLVKRYRRGWPRAVTTFELQAHFEVDGLAVIGVVSPAFLCRHPNEPVHLDILEAACERFIFVEKDDARVSRLREAATLRGLVSRPAVATSLGSLLPPHGVADGPRRSASM